MSFTFTKLQLMLMAALLSAISAFLTHAYDVHSEYQARLQIQKKAFADTNWTSDGIKF